MRFHFSIIVLLSCFIGCGPSPQKPKSATEQNKALKICVIDVDQGDAILVISPDNKYMLIDGGKPTYGNNEVVPLLDSLKITHLDYIFASHYDADHIGGLDEVVGHIDKDSIINYCYDRGDTFKTGQFLDYKLSIVNKRKKIRAGDVIDLNDLMIKCECVNGKLVSGDSVPVKDENDFCIGLVIKYKDFEFFTAGDIGGMNASDHKDVETKLAPLVGDIDIYKVSHHGSKYSSNTLLVSTIKPEAAIISVGTNTYGHPEQLVINRLVNAKCLIYQTNVTNYGIIPESKGVILNSDIWIRVYANYYIVNSDTLYFGLI